MTPLWVCQMCARDSGGARTRKHLSRSARVLAMVIAGVGLEPTTPAIMSADPCRGEPRPSEGEHAMTRHRAPRKRGITGALDGAQFAGAVSRTGAFFGEWNSGDAAGWPGPPPTSSAKLPVMAARRDCSIAIPAGGGKEEALPIKPGEAPRLTCVANLCRKPRMPRNNGGALALILCSRDRVHSFPSRRAARGVRRRSMVWPTFSTHSSRV